RLKTEIKKLPELIRLCDRIATEDVVLQHTGKGPCEAGVGGKTPAALPEVRGDVVELPPGNCHLVPISRVNGNRTLVSRIAENVLVICIDVHLVACKHAKLRDHSR